MVLSDTPALRAFFSRGAVYTDHTPAGLADAVRAARADHARLSTEVVALRQNLAEQWRARLHGLESEMGRLS